MSYLFDYLTPGGYVVRFDKTTIPAGATFTVMNGGSDDGLDNDADTEGNTAAYALFDGDRDLTADAGISSTGPLLVVTPPSTTVPDTTTTTAAPAVIPAASIVVPTTTEAPKPKASNVTGVVFIDNDRSKEMGNNEFGRSGVTVRILDESGKVVGTTTSDEQGRFNFDVPPGDYVIEITPPSELGATTPIRRKITVKGVQVEADATLPGATAGRPAGRGGRVRSGQRSRRVGLYRLAESDADSLRLWHGAAWFGDERACSPTPCRTHPLNTKSVPDFGH